MHEIVADTAPLNYLVLIEAVGILPRLFASVLIPPGRQERTLAWKCTGCREYLDCQSTLLAESGES